MTLDRVGVELPPASAPEAILDICDGLLGEIGRRMHRFAWLPDPSAPIVSYLPLDSYYPGNRVVVVFAPRTAEQERLCREQVPAHGLHLLWLHPDELAGAPADTSTRLLEQLRLLGPLPERPRERVYRKDPEPSRPPGVDRSLGTLATATATRSEPPRRPQSAAAAATLAAKADAAVATHAARPPKHSAEFRAREGAGLLLGLALALVLGGETLLLVILFALEGGHVLLAIGLAFDVCARGLGTIAAIRDGNEDSAWGCLVFGSPAAVSFAFAGDEPVQTEPAPLAGALGALAIALCVLWVLGAIVGA
ncbi:MAG: hypothetical protein ACYDHH_02885 [Solirubrobacteraceae bacterium]